MQQLTAAPRDSLTADQVTRLLVEADTVWSAGLELITSSGPVDISDDLVGGSVTWDATADTSDAAGVVYRSCQLQITTALAWGRDKLQVFVTGTDPATSVSARFNLGVFLFATPRQAAGETPVTYDVTGEDLLQQFVGAIDDAVTFAAGSNCLGNATAVILQRDPTATVVVTGTSTTILDDDAVYLLAESDTPTWLRIINDQLQRAGYQRVWVDETGHYQLQPLADPTTRAAEWTFDADDPDVTLVGGTRTLTEDAWSAYNAWKFIASGLTFPPEEGNGQYTPPDNTSDGPTSITAIGRRNQHTVFLQAADQDALVAQGDAIVAQDKQLTATIEITTYPFPLVGHNDVVSYIDTALGGTRKLFATRWTFDLGFADTQWTWSWKGASGLTTSSGYALGTVTIADIASLRVLLDGHDSDVPAAIIDGLTVNSGDRVNVLLRTPLKPLVVGRETTVVDPAAGNVTQGDLAGALASYTLPDGSVTTVKIADGAVTATQIAPNGVTTSVIADGAITTTKITNNAITTPLIAANAIVSSLIAANAITATQIAAAAVTAGKIDAGAVTATEIAAGAVTASKIHADAIDGMTITGATLQTAPSGRRVVISGTTYDQIDLFPAISTDTHPYIQVYEDSSRAYVVISGARRDSGVTKPLIAINSDDGTGGDNGSIELLAPDVAVQGRLSAYNLASGSTAVTLDSNGQATIWHGLSYTPAAVIANYHSMFVGGGNATPRHVHTAGYTGTDFTVTVFNTTTGAVAAGASVTIDWIAHA